MNTFAEILKVQMKISGVSMEKLCEGLCSQSLFTRICNGERTADKLLRDRLMQRLCISETRYESFLFQEEYDGWKQRQTIVNCINQGKLDQAERLLLEYKKQISVEKKLEQQFYMTMEAQILCIQDKEKDRIKELIEQALKLTVPNIHKKSLHELVLSEQEMDLILEYACYCKPERMTAYCQELLDYIDHRVSDEYMKVKIFPKIVHYQCIAWEMDGILDCNVLLKNCNKAIMCLRNTQKLYYFLELLCEREKLYMYFLSDAEAKKEHLQIEALKKIQKENALWKQTLEEMYEICGVPLKMQHSCYLYHQKDVFCINDIIYKRRMMLKMTRKQLCEGICSEKTIARVELTGGKMQMPILREVLDRLGMSGEYQKIDIVSSDPTALQLVRDIATHGNNRELPV